MVDAQTTVFASAVWWTDNDPFFHVIALTPAKARAEAQRAMQEAAKQAYEDETYPSRAAAMSALHWNGANAFALGTLASPAELPQAVLDLQTDGVFFPESANPLGTGAKIAIGYVAVVAVGALLYYALKPAAAAPAAPALAPSAAGTAPPVPASLVSTQLTTSTGYTAVVSSAGDPSAALQAAGFTLSASAPFGQSSSVPGQWTGSVTWNGSIQNVMPVAGVTWVSLTPA